MPARVCPWFPLIVMDAVPAPKLTTPPWVILAVIALIVAPGFVSAWTIYGATWEEITPTAKA